MRTAKPAPLSIRGLIAGRGGVFLVGRLKGDLDRGRELLAIDGLAEDGIRPKEHSTYRLPGDSLCGAFSR